MTAILFEDIVAVVIAGLASQLDRRPESYTNGVTVARTDQASTPKLVTVAYGGGAGESDTLDTSLLTVTIADTSETVASDLARMVRALLTARGDGTFCDGRPITRITTSIGQLRLVDDPSRCRIRIVFEIRHRGTALTPVGP
ncbi:hypothetical protein [Plantibacter sp. YIM 135249]|uniref:hypothetical protein n=1 Tax=Plantibacter sp. YIM 135249 TaxID=3423918 RepID=UPI003D33779A